MKTAIVLLILTLYIANIRGHGNDNNDNRGNDDDSCGNVRTYNGTCNNRQRINLGAAGGFFSQREGYRNWTGISLPNERTVSNTIFAYPDGPLDKDYSPAQRKFGLLPDPEDRNGFFVAFSQFIAHDISQNPLGFNTQNIASNYHVQIQDPTDPLYQPTINSKTGILTMTSTGTTVDGVFYSRNDNSNFLDLSPVYGSSERVNSLLRTFTGGRLETDETGLGLPFAAPKNVPSECGAFRPGVSAAGDIRADENGVLTAIHTMFLRLHNQHADEIAEENPNWSDERIFQEARKYLIAEYQNVVYSEFLPTLLGSTWNRFRNYRGYDKNIDPTPTNSFATAAFRIVHDMVPLPFLFLDDQCGAIIPPVQDDVPIQESSNCIPLFFRQIGMTPAIRGSLQQYAQATDHRTVNGLRSVFLRRSTPGGNMDIETANIFRGREHGLVDFNTMRRYWTGENIYNRPRCSSVGSEDSIGCFLEITRNQSLAQDLKRLYKKVNLIDAYVGMLAEDAQGGSTIPRTSGAIIADQFDRLRRGDRFYFENGMFSPRETRQIKEVEMSDMLRRAFPELRHEIRNNAFKVHNHCDL